MEVLRTFVIRQSELSRQQVFEGEPNAHWKRGTNSTLPPATLIPGPRIVQRDDERDEWQHEAPQEGQHEAPHEAPVTHRRGHSPETVARVMLLTGRGRNSREIAESMGLTPSAVSSIRALVRKRNAAPKPAPKPAPITQLQTQLQSIAQDCQPAKPIIEPAKPASNPLLRTTLPRIPDAPRLFVLDWARKLAAIEFEAAKPVKKPRRSTQSHTNYLTRPQMKEALNRYFPITATVINPAHHPLEAFYK